VAAIVIIAGLGCGRASVVVDTEVTSGGTDSEPDVTGVDPAGPSMSTTTGTGGTTTTTVSSTMDPDGSSGSSGPDVGALSGFITPADAPEWMECSTWNQDCPPGEKCMPWANDGGIGWNATRCSPLADEPASVGEPCTVEESGVSGIDTCDATSMCWNVDPETMEGMCTSFCLGSENDPICLEPGQHCLVSEVGALSICLPDCNPLLQECQDGQGCWPIGDVFGCSPDACRASGAYGDPCSPGYGNVCCPGLVCVDAAEVPGCRTTGCCTDICDLGEPSLCNDPTQSCLPWYEPGQAPPGYEDVGVCAIAD
jgi:hypothetical protein